MANQEFQFACGSCVRMFSVPFGEQRKPVACPHCGEEQQCRSYPFHNWGICAACNNGYPLETEKLTEMAECPHCAQNAIWRRATVGFCPSCCKCATWLGTASLSPLPCSECGRESVRAFEEKPQRKRGTPTAAEYMKMRREQAAALDNAVVAANTSTPQQAATEQPRQGMKPSSLILELGFILLLSWLTSSLFNASFLFTACIGVGGILFLFFKSHGR